MTLAVAEALMNGGAEEDYIASMQRWGRRYPDGGYGGRFRLRGGGKSGMIEKT